MLGGHWDRLVSGYIEPYHELLGLDPQGRVDSARSAHAKHLLEKAKRKMERKLHESHSAVEGLAGEFGKRTSDFQRSQLAKQAEAALGVNLYDMKDADVGDHLHRFVQDSVRLITSIPEDQHDRIEDTVMEAVHAGTHHEVLQKRLRERFGISARHARLIARDQTTKLYSRVNRARTENLGISRYTWSTMNDERVRDSHDALEGTVWSYEHPPVVDGEFANPGEPILCRCYADPLWDDVLQ